MILALNWFAQDTWDQMGTALTGLVGLLTVALVLGSPLVALLIQKYFELQKIVRDNQRAIQDNSSAIDAHKETLVNLAEASPKSTAVLLKPLDTLDKKEL